MKKAKVNGEPIEVPQNYDELTFGKFVGLVEAAEDQAKQISVIIGQPEEVVRKAHITGLENIISSMGFLRQPVVIDEFPEKVGEYKLPKDLAFESVEQFECLKAEIAKAGKSSDHITATRALATYAAIYCQGINEPFDMEKAGYLAKQFENYPCREVMSAGSFFMAKALSIQSGLTMSYLRKNIPMRNSRQGLKRLTRPLASMRPWIWLLVMWGKLKKRFSNGR